MPEVVLGQRVRIEDVVAVARDGAAVRVAPAVRERLRSARAVVERLAASEEPVYGLTTGLGAKSSLRLPADEREAFQTRVLLGRAVAAGEPYPTDVVRAMLLARAAGLAQGGSGISPAVFDALLALLDRRVHPIVPSQGSVGTADLALCAALALPLIGLGHAELGGERLAGAEALGRAGLEAVALHVKDGLALVSANAGSVGHGALAAHDAHVYLDTALAAGALSLAAFQGSLTPFDVDVAAARPAAGQEDAARRLRALAEPGIGRLLQDPLSFRCLAAIQGAADAALARAREAVEVELNSAADNPLVLTLRGTLVSNGNFHVAALALAFEGLGLAVAQLALAAAQRVLRLLEPRRSGLPLGLTTRGDRAGLVPLGITLSHTWAELRALAAPVLLDGLPLADGVEDHAPQAPAVVAKTDGLVALACRITAIELVVAAQAVDLRGRSLTSEPLRALHAAVRDTSATVDDDRPLGAELEELTCRVRRGELAGMAS
jgi:histidine ammonia-lyase